MQPEEIRHFLHRAIVLSREGMLSGKGGPFGCVIVKGGTILAEASNRVLADMDPTAHAEVVAIREACLHLGSFQLDGCTLFSSCEPCPMCLGAIYWARPEAIYYVNSRKDAALAGFDDAFIYGEIGKEGPERNIPFVHFPLAEGAAVFEEWKRKSGKQEY